MKAVRWHARHDVRLEEIPDAPPPGPGEVRIDVAYCGLCGSDVHEYLHGPDQIPTTEHPTTGSRAPVVLGHEVSGWIADVGPGVDLPRGALVALNALEPCGVCRSCQGGAPQRCVALGHIGLSVDGGLAEQLTVPAEMVLLAPEGLSAQLTALAEPFAVAMHAVSRAGTPCGQRCLVLGAGAIGLAIALVLRELGNDVCVADIDQDRLQAARDLGLLPHDPRTSAPTTVFECAGAAQAPAEAMRRAAPGGLVVLCGLPERLSEIDVSDVVMRELRIIGSVGHLTDPDLRDALDLLVRQQDAARQLVSAVVPLSDAVGGGLDILGGPERSRHTKILVEINDHPIQPRYRRRED